MATTPVTRTSLVARVATRANTSGYADTSVNGEVSGLVDLSLAKIHNLLAAELYEDYFQKRFHFQLVTNQSLYQLPSDFMKPRAVFYAQPSSAAPNDLSLAQRWPLRRMDPTQETNLVTTSSYPNLPFGYAFEDRCIAILPIPTSTPQNYIELFYIPQYVPATNDATPIEFAICFGWDEWVVQDVAIQIRNKAMLPAQELVAERAMYEERIRIQAKNRNPLEPFKVRDTGWRYGNGGAPYGQFSFR